jgi:hypothetical protein
MLKVKILKEVYSDKQRKYMCAMKEPNADRPDGLDQDEAEEMCSGPMKEEPIEEVNAMAAGNVQGAVASQGGPWATKENEVKKFNEEEKKISKLKGKPLDEMYSTMGIMSGEMRHYTDEGDGLAQRAQYQGLRNVPKPKKRMKIRVRRKKKLSLNENSSVESLIRFATKPRNQKHLKNIIDQIFNEYKFEQLWKATVSDNSSKERIEFMSKNIPDVIPNMHKQILKGDEAAIRDYYYFLATEYLYWTLNNPRAHPSRKGVGIFEMTEEIRNYVMSHIDRYAHPKYGKSSKNNPKALSQTTIGPNSPSQKKYGEKGTLDPFLYKLPE